MGRARSAVLLLGTTGMAAAVMAVMRHGRGAARGRGTAGGVLIDDAGAYDSHSRLLLGRFFRGIAADVATSARAGSRILEVGCGPGLLSVQLAREHGLEVTGLDLDPAMIERARANATASGFDHEAPSPAFVVGDVAALPFPDRSFDLVVSTLSMHHWTDPTAGLAEIGRVLRGGGRALIWEFRPGIVPLHRHVPDPAEHAGGLPLRVASATTWRWPWRLALTQRTELVRADLEPGKGTMPPLD